MQKEKEIKKKRKKELVIKLMPMERFMTREDLALLFIPFSKQKSVRVRVIFYS